MDFYRRINRFGAIAPAVMSLLALCVVLIAVATGWESHLPDEGAAAHVFQLLIVGQVPLILLYLATVKSTHATHVVRHVTVQFGALGVAIGSVAFFGL